MKSATRYTIASVYQYATWHSGEKELINSLIQDAVVSAAAFSRARKDFHNRVLRMVRRDLAYLDRLEKQELDKGKGGPDNTHTFGQGRYSALFIFLRTLSFNSRDIVILHLLLGHGIREMPDILGINRREVICRVAVSRREMAQAYHMNSDNTTGVALPVLSRNSSALVVNSNALQVKSA